MKHLKFFIGFFVLLFVCGCSTTGAHLHKSNKESIKWFKKAAEQGEADAQYGLAKAYFAAGNTQSRKRRGFKWLEKAAAQDHTKAKVLLGRAYLEGVGVAKDADKGVKTLFPLVAKNIADAQFALGQFYFNPKGDKEKLKKSIQLFKKAAAQDHLLAQIALGIAYANGWGISKNNDKAIKLLSNVMEKKRIWRDIDLMAKTEIILAGVYIGNKNYKKFKYWATRSALLRKNTVAQNALARFYLDKKIGKEDLDEALKWAKMGAAKKDKESQFLMGIIYGRKKNIKESVKWMEKAAKQGHVKAQTGLGLVYSSPFSFILDRHNLQSKSK